jgi:hypothetical protein
VVSRTVLIPTFIGHLAPVKTLAASIREHCGNDVEIVLVIGATERPAFEELARERCCRLLEIEELLFNYTGRRVDANRLLVLIDRFRFQTLKKLLGVATLSGDVLILDSESLVMRDLAPLFDGGISETTVVYSERPWHTMESSLTTEVHTECCDLLEKQPYWFFESFNWLYSSDLVRDLLQHLWAAHGQEWVFRARPLFECQLYFQYAHSRGAGYRFVTAHDILASHFGDDRAATLLRTIYSSPLAPFGVFEYLARFVSREEYIGFVADPQVLQHFRLMRHEPYEFYDIVGAVRRAAGSDPNYFGEASMHRRPLLSGRIAVIASGRFHQEEDAHNLRHFLRGVDCDLFLGIGSDAWPDATVQEILRPRRIARVDDAAELRARSMALEAAQGAAEQPIKPERDIGSMAMFDKMAAGWGALLDQEAARGERYSVVVRTRPDIFATRGLHDILWDVAEKMGSLEGSLLVPDRFWSQGVNDQLFLGLREEMGRLFEGINGMAYAACEFRNPEYFLGSRLRAAGLAPVPFPFEYILTRGKQPRLRDVQQRLDMQSRQFWSSTVDLPPWKDAGSALDEALANARLKNGCMKPVVVPTTRGVEADLLFARDENGRPCMLMSEHKSPAVFLLWLPRLMRAFAPQAIAAGLLRPRQGQSVRLESFDAASGRIELSISTARKPSRSQAVAPGEQKDAQPRISLQLTTPPRSALVALARWSLKAAHALLKDARLHARGMRRHARDLRARWRLSRL